MDVLVDSREPKKFYDFLVAAFPEHNISRGPSSECDYLTDTCIVERKTLMDLHGSVIGKEKRFFDQRERIWVREDSVRLLLITGSTKDYIDECNNQGIEPKMDTLYSAISSSLYRYDMHTLWVQNDWDGLIEMMRIMERIDKGQYMVPSKKDPDVLSAKLCGVTMAQWRVIREKFGPSFVDIAAHKPEDLTCVYGIVLTKSEKVIRMLSDGY